MDEDDVDGFMAALGFSGFQVIVGPRVEMSSTPVAKHVLVQGPTLEVDLGEAFDKALQASRPEALAGAAMWDCEVAAATHRLLLSWQRAYAENAADGL